MYQKLLDRWSVIKHKILTGMNLGSGYMNVTVQFIQFFCIFEIFYIEI